MYREVIGNSGCFRTPETKSNAPGGNRALKPRFICDARYLNLMCEHSELKMDGVGKVAQCSWQGTHQISMDPSQGFTTYLYIQVHGRITGCTERKFTTCGPSCVSDGVW